MRPGLAPGAGHFLGFVLAGGVATVVNYAVFLGLLSLGTNYLISSALGYASGILISYGINKAWVFRESESRKSQFGRYFVAYMLALGAQLVLLWALVSLGLQPEIANALAIVVVVILNFFVIRKFVF